MVKLIVSDVDGTLLPKNQSALSDTAVSLIRQTAASGIFFAAASGRSPQEMRRLFAPVADISYLICLDGGVVLKGDSVLWETPVCPHMVAHIARETNQNQQIEVFYNNQKQNKNTEKTKIYKISLHGEQAFSIGKRLTGQYEHKVVSVIPSAGLWYEIVSHGVSKGSAVQKLQETLHVGKAETMAIGDGYNDISMLERAHISCATQYAWPMVKEKARYTVKNGEEAIGGMLHGTFSYGRRDKITEDPATDFSLI